MLRRLTALLCALALLSGCIAGTSAGTGEGYAVYFTVPFDPGSNEERVEGPALASETRRIPEGEEPLNALMEALLSGPLSDGLASPFPAGTRQLSPPVLENGVCTVDLSEQYGGLSEVDLTLADYCITLTLCQVEGVDAVTILVEGAVIPYGDHQMLRESDVVLSSAEDEPVYLTADLYFLREGGGLAVETRELLVPSGAIPAEVLLKALLSGPETPGLYLPIPEGAELIDLWINSDGTCYVSFSAPFLEGEPAPTSQARLLLYAIVNTLCQLSDVSAVRLLVEGESPEEYGGVPTTSPLEPNQNLVVP
ncbi:GerMN domain-containing protein [uncultured Intestinimonas sp.]|uniref:GerMN domain-containing protein n=1 Tax=uncultured Intestinimonas sp. TaxID=1689265 RepID=UPI0025D8B1FB|nr:GerMN domain-containing protein [uncultured Intestinimonas sp.]